MPTRFVRTVLALAVATLLAAGLTVSTSTTASAAGFSARVAPDVYEKRVQRRINEIRAARGLGRLRLSGCADGTAETWAGYLARTDQFFHQSMSTVLDRCRGARYAGETLGKGSISPRRLVRMWMQSPGHRAILISQNPRAIGIGARLDRHGQWVTAANFVRF